MIQATSSCSDPLCDHLIAEWEPLETAPKMKCVLLFAVTDIGEDGAVRNWRMGSGFWNSGKEAWIWEGSEVRSYDVPPTHWMPLPAPPVSPDEKRSADESPYGGELA